jgi:hypothetical protein
MAGKGHVGKAGQLATMAELLLRGYNVAMPEVDLGDDVFVVEDDSGQLWRVQVKTAIGKRRGYGYSGQFAVQEKQLSTKKKPDLNFVFALRAGGDWEFVILPRRRLKREQDDYQIGSSVGETLVFNFRFRRGQVLCGGRDFQAFRNTWSAWPVTPTR